MKTFTVILGCFILAGCATSETSGFKEWEYQNTRWGMAREEVQAARPSTHEYPGGSFPKGTLVEFAAINNAPSAVAYFFGPKGLYQVLVGFTPQDPATSSYNATFQNVKHLLTEKYGPPDEDSSKVAAVAALIHKLPSIPPETTFPSVWRREHVEIKLGCTIKCDYSDAGNSPFILYTNLALKASEL